MTDWILEYDSFEPEQEGLRESLCTLGNGYFCTRGGAAEAVADEYHYPGTYLAGGYNRLHSALAEWEIEYEDLVNLPNWLPLRLRLADGQWLDLLEQQVLRFRQVLDLRRGLLTREVVIADSQGRRTRLKERRLVHMGQPHLAAQELSVTPEDWEGTVELVAGLDGGVINAGVERYALLDGRHLEPVVARALDHERLLLQVRTRHSELTLSEAARLRVQLDGQAVESRQETMAEEGQIAFKLSIALTAGQVLRAEKVVALYTSRDFAVADSASAAGLAIARAGGFEELLASHARAWRHLWRYFDMELGLTSPVEQAETELVLRLHVFHLLQTVSLHSIDLDAGVPARGWHGEAYRGHVFWDELFIAPFLNLRLPEVVRALLMYRWRRLGEARARARECGRSGALFPWQSGSDGREESQRLHLNPRSGRWLPDHSRLQFHVNSAIAYNIWQYWQASGDTEFLSFYGAEMLFEIARFWASLAEENRADGRYDIRGVLGPDEFHDGYPGAASPGIDNNAYTNVMAAWVLGRALEMLSILPDDRREELCDSLALATPELQLWDRVRRGLRICFHADGVISQFQGYETLEELDWAAYERRYGNIQRLDRLLEAEGDSPNRYKVSKQADVLMLFYLFSTEELNDIFHTLGYPFRGEQVPVTIRYYLDRTSHGSTLSWVVHSWVLARSDRRQSWLLFSEALASDIADIQGGTTAEGIHLGAMAGTIDLVQRGYTGIELRAGVLWLNPVLPDTMERLRLALRYRGHSLCLEVTHHGATIRSEACHELPIRIGWRGVVYDLSPEGMLEFSKHN